MLSSSGATPETLERFYDELRGFSTSPLWLVQEEALVAEPKSKALPFLWRWRDLRPQALRAGDLIGTADAERRVLMLLNPGLNRMATTNSMFAGLQIVMPGEAARGPPAHTGGHSGSSSTAKAAQPRSTATASPCIPATWCSHQLDLARSRQRHRRPHHLAGRSGHSTGAHAGGSLLRTIPEDVQPVTEPDRLVADPLRGGTLRPSWETSGAAHSPLMHYPWKQTWETLQRLAPEVDGSPYDGVIMEYTTQHRRDR